MEYTFMNQTKQENKKRNLNTLIKKLSFIGVDPVLLTKRIIPLQLQSIIGSHEQEIPDFLFDNITKYISAVYGWTSEEIWTCENLSIGSEPAKLAFFKKPSNANINQIKAYSHYAYYLAKTVLKSVPYYKNIIEYPESIDEFKSKYRRYNKELDLYSLLRFVWKMGICVLPLNDAGFFHGASWNIEGRHVIVLKQNTQSHAIWIFNLLHELYHVFAHLNENNSSVIETEELNPFLTNDASEELEANSFANQVIFGNNAEVYVRRCIIIANRDIKNLSKAVNKVSKEEKIREDFLSNYLAYRLSYQGENWWSSALKKQITNPNPFAITTSLLIEHARINKLSTIDYNLLTTALAN